MLTVYSEDHRLRDARTELHGGRLVRPFERPERADIILARVRETGLGPVEPPRAHGPAPLHAVHDRDYLTFMAQAWEAWRAAGHEGEAIPVVWPARRMSQRIPRDIEGMLGYYAMGAETSLTEGTWAAARAAADVALTAAEAVSAGARAAFALTRPPGHHAARDLFGGYCFLNNAAIAAQAMRAAGAARVAILDVDFHHGNGTQDIFRERPDVMVLSIHGHPEDAFPHFSGHADETGEGPGEGFTANYPLPSGTAFPDWAEALSEALRRIRAFGPDALVVSLGVDTYAGDPISFFRLASEDFTAMGARLAGAGLPTLFVMEGGYAVAEIGINTVNVLTGFEGS